MSMYNKNSKIYKCSNCGKFIIGDNGMVFFNNFDKKGCPIKPFLAHKNMSGKYNCDPNTRYCYEIGDFFDDFSYNIVRRFIED
jgi:hypothetical protein